MPQIFLEQFRRFLDWTTKKVVIHFSDRSEVYFEEREVWWASLGENIGAEINGKNFHFERPVIILRKFSRDLLLVIPLTSKMKKGSWYYRFSFDEKDRTAVIVQMRTISNRRLIRKIGNIAPEDFSVLQNMAVRAIKTEPPMNIGGSSDPLARTI